MELDYEYDFPAHFLKGLALTQSFVFRDSRRPTIPGCTRQDISASYRVTLHKTRFTLAARMQNVTDLQYWEGFQSRGAPRTTSVSLSTRF
jgi:outer membrane receptor protein involved in Fe transport